MSEKAHPQKAQSEKMQVEILQIKAGDVDEELVSAMQNLLPQLSKTGSMPEHLNGKYLEDLVKSDNCILFAAKTAGDGRNVGSLTLVIYSTPSGKRARIEDVVVDESYRGKGIGSKLNTAAIQKATELGARTLDLTSAPDRQSANAMYQKLGFVKRDTNVYRKTLE